MAAAIGTEDRLEILDLYGRYNHLFDFAEAENWAGLFTPDGSLSGATPQPVQGAKNLTAWLLERHEAYQARGSAVRHLVGNIALDATAAGALGRAYLTVYAVGTGEYGKVLMTGRYEDKLVKTSAGWRFQSRVFTLDP